MNGYQAYITFLLLGIQSKSYMKIFNNGGLSFGIVSTVMYDPPCGDDGHIG